MAKTGMNDAWKEPANAQEPNSGYKKNSCTHTKSEQGNSTWV